MVADGLVDSVVPDDASRPATCVDLSGQLLLPGFVDVHVHLDKAYQLTELGRLGEDLGGIEGALRATALLRRSLTLGDVARGARRAVDTLISGGTVAARAHVEVSPSADPATVRVHVELAESSDLELQLSAFAQHGTTGDRDVLKRMAVAMEEGCTVVGGCPYADPDPLAHLDQMIALALDTDSPLDLHLDLSDDEGDILLGEVIPRVERAGLHGRVLVSHETALTAASPQRVKELAVATAGAGITVVSIPTTDLYLSGRRADRAPTRGVTRIAELTDAGVPVALASNNYENAFTPVTMPSLSHAAWLASLTNWLGTHNQQMQLLDAITMVPRTVMPAPGLEIGCRIGAIALPVLDPVDVVRSAARPTWRFTRTGATRLGPALEAQP